MVQNKDQDGNLSWNLVSMGCQHGLQGASMYGGKD